MIDIMTRRRALCAIAAVTVGSPLTAQDARIARVRAAASTIVAAELMRDVSYIASDALLGRATPSPGFDSAAAFVARRIKSLGVTPMGDSGTYFQHYVVRRATLDTAAVSATVNGQRFGWNSGLVVTSFVTPGTSSGAVMYVGNGLRIPARHIDPYAGVEIRGKWLLVQPQAAPSRRNGTNLDTLGTPGVDYTTALDEARQRGALGVLTVPAPAATRDWAAQAARTPSSRDLAPTLGRAYAPYPLPQIRVSSALLTALLAGSRIAPADLISADSAQRPAPAFELPQPLTIDLEASSTTVRPYNVVGLIEGSDPRLRNEWVTVSTHLDGAVGRGATPQGDSIFNAADDNGSGSAANLSIARAILRGPRPRRSILLIWDSGEETGLWGSRFVAYGPLAKNVVAHFTVDMIARTRQPGTNVRGEEELSGPGVVYADGPGVLSSELDSVLARAQRTFGYVTLDRKYEDPKHEFFYPRTDAAPYVENGIPYVEWFTGLHADYHRQTDEVTRLDPVKFEAVARMVYATLWTAADDPVRPRIDKPIPPVLWFVKPR